MNPTLLTQLPQARRSSMALVELSGRWWKPADLRAFVDEARAKMPERQFLRGQASKPLRESWIASSFASQRPGNGDCEIFPVAEKEQFPDFKLRLVGHPHDELW